MEATPGAPAPPTHNPRKNSNLAPYGTIGGLGESKAKLQLA